MSTKTKATPQEIQAWIEARSRTERKALRAGRRGQGGTEATGE
jgi:hypothetical protein